MKKKLKLVHIANLSQIKTFALVFILAVFFTSISRDAQRGVFDCGAIWCSSMVLCLNHSGLAHQKAAVIVLTDKFETDNLQQLQYSTTAPFEFSQTLPEYLKITTFDVITMAILGLLAERKIRKLFFQK